MRKSILIVFIFFVCFQCAAQNCQEAYMSALQKYKNKKYVEAQRELIIVAQSCGDYSDVWKILKECNKKISEIQIQQTSEIQNLKEENKKHVKQKEGLESEKIQLTKEKSDAIGQVAKLNEANGKLRQDISNLQKDTAGLKREIVNLKDTVRMLRDEVATNADAQNATLKAINEAADSIAVVREEFVKLQAAVNQLRESIEKQTNQDDPKSLKRSPISELQDSVETLNDTLTKIYNQIGKIQSGKLVKKTKVNNPK